MFPGALLSMALFTVAPFLLSGDFGRNIRVMFVILTILNVLGYTPAFYLLLRIFFRTGPETHPSLTAPKE
jgi:hypothetical protein